MHTQKDFDRDVYKNPYLKVAGIRQALADDVSSIATLFSLTPDDGSVYRFPHILEHPDEMCETHIGWLRPGVHEPRLVSASLVYRA
jgi:hypothetical protein